MTTRLRTFSSTRRQFLAGAAGLAVLAAVPVSGLSAFGERKVSRPRAWLGRFDERLGLWRPVWEEAEVPSEQALELRIRGPWALAGTMSPTLALGVVYRSLPAQPFRLPREGCGGGIVLHAAASALAGVCVWRDGEPPEQGTLCALNCGTGPLLSPGRYAILIDDGTGSLQAPAWSALAHPGDGTAPLRYHGHPAPQAAMSMNVVPA